MPKVLPELLYINFDEMEEVTKFVADNKRYDVRVLAQLFNFLTTSINMISEDILSGEIQRVLQSCQIQESDLIGYMSLVIVSSMSMQFSNKGEVELKLRDQLRSLDAFIQCLVMCLSEVHHSHTRKVIEDILEGYSAIKERAHGSIRTRNSYVRSHSSKGACGIESLDPIVSLLAKMRKLGMDMLFPQLAHDKVLSCIYVSMKALNRPAAHRDLIDLVMHIKETNYFTDFTTVSKTKIRGILALLKHSEILIPYLHGDDPVKLQLSPQLQSFLHYRQYHDEFLVRFFPRNKVHLPEHLLGHVLWSKNYRTSTDQHIKYKGIQTFMKQVEEYYSGVDLNAILEAAALRDENAHIYDHPYDITPSPPSLLHTYHNELSYMDNKTEQQQQQQHRKSPQSTFSDSVNSDTMRHTASPYQTHLLSTMTDMASASTPTHKYRTNNNNLMTDIWEQQSPRSDFTSTPKYALSAAFTHHPIHTTSYAVNDSEGNRSKYIPHTAAVPMLTMPSKSSMTLTSPRYITNSDSYDTGRTTRDEASLSTPISQLGNIYSPNAPYNKDYFNISPRSYTPYSASKNITSTDRGLEDQHMPFSTPHHDHHSTKNPDHYLHHSSVTMNPTPSTPSYSSSIKRSGHDTLNIHLPYHPHTYTNTSTNSNDSTTNISWKPLSTSPTTSSNNIINNTRFNQYLTTTNTPTTPSSFMDTSKETHMRFNNDDYTIRDTFHNTEWRRDYSGGSSNIYRKPMSESIRKDHYVRTPTPTSYYNAPHQDSFYTYPDTSTQTEDKNLLKGYISPTTNDISSSNVISTTATTAADHPTTTPSTTNATTILSPWNLWWKSSSSTSSSSSSSLNNVHPPPPPIDLQPLIPPSYSTLDPIALSSIQSSYNINDQSHMYSMESKNFTSSLSPLHTYYPMSTPTPPNTEQSSMKSTTTTSRHSEDIYIDSYLYSSIDDLLLNSRYGLTSPTPMRTPSSMNNKLSSVSTTISDNDLPSKITPTTTNTSTSNQMPSATNTHTHVDMSKLESSFSPSSCYSVTDYNLPSTPTTLNNYQGMSLPLTELDNERTISNINTNIVFDNATFVHNHGNSNYVDSDNTPTKVTVERSTISLPTASSMMMIYDSPIIDFNILCNNEDNIYPMSTLNDNAYMNNRHVVQMTSTDYNNLNDGSVTDNVHEDDELKEGCSEGSHLDDVDYDFLHIPSRDKYEG